MSNPSKGGKSKQRSTPASARHEPPDPVADMPLAATYAAARTPSGAVSAGWREVDLDFMAPQQTASPAFPIDLLPDAIRAMMIAFCLARQLVMDFVAMSILTAFSGAIGNRVRVLTFEGEKEPLAVYTTLVGDSSSGKSKAVAISEQLLSLIEEEMQTAHATITKGKASGPLGAFERRIHDAVRMRLQLEGVGPSDTDDALVPEPPGIMLHVTTGVGLLDELRSGCAGRILISHELVGSLAYTASSQGLHSRSLILEGYDGDRKVKRTRTDGRIVIPSLWIAILGVTQPSRLGQLLGDASDGLAARTWWIHPDVPPRRGLPSSPGPVNELKETLARLISLRPAGGPGSSYSALLRLAEGTRAPLEAAIARWDTHRRLTDGLYRDFVGRASQHAIRLSGLLAIAEQAALGREGLPEEIPIDMMERAVAFVDSYLMPMAERTLSAAQVAEESDAARLARYLARKGKPVVIVRADIHRGDSPVKDAQRVAIALEELRQRHVVRPLARPEGRLGRPSIAFEVNPALFAWAAKSPQD